MLFKKKKFKILIVCHANITRSPYIMGYMKKILNENYSFLKSKIKIYSAGIEAKKNSPAHDVVKYVAKLNKFSLDHHKSSLLTKNMIKKFNIILTMEKHQKEYLIEKNSSYKNKIFQIKEFCWNNKNNEDLEIPDPTGNNTDDYKKFIETAHNESDRIINALYRKDKL